jgi:shikimate kinase
LADKKGIDFYDLDDLVENRAQMTISRLFFLHGEEEFRKVENKILNDFFASHRDEDWVLALGGGTPCYLNNLETILQNGTLFFLDASIPTITERLKRQNQQRPLLKDNPAQKLEKLLQERLAFYQKAHFKVNANEKSDLVAAKITTMLDAK